MEEMDIVNKQDSVIRQAPRSLIYEQKLTHRIVHVLIFNKNGEMAMQLRSKNVSFCPGYWSTTVGGHVKAGETYEEAASREMQEEIGVLLPMEFFSKDLYECDGLSKFLTVYKTNYDGPFHVDVKDVEKVEYFPVDIIKDMVKSGVKIHPELLFLLNKYF